MRTILSALAVMALAVPAAADETLKVKEGDKMPDINLKVALPDEAPSDLKGKDEVSFDDLKGKNVVLFFYPRAMTRGCTIESCGFRDVADKFAKLDTLVIGISTDKVGPQEQFIEKESLNFPLLADDEMKMTKALGVMSPRGNASQRVTFVVDKEGTIRKIYDSVSPANHPKEVLDYVEKNLAK